MLTFRDAARARQTGFMTAPAADTYSHFSASSFAFTAATRSRIIDNAELHLRYYKERRRKHASLMTSMLQACRATAELVRCRATHFIQRYALDHT